MCLLAADYAEVVMAAEQALETAGLDAAERDLVFGANARRVYRLPEPTDDRRRLTMLRTQLIHPQILGALAEAGHGSQVLISDGNFPHVTATPPGARRVYLNLSPAG